MQYKCDVCHDSGSKNQTGDYLDCPACDMPHTRKALNDFVKSLGPTHPEDVALAIHQRALAMAPKQEVPAGWKLVPEDPTGDMFRAAAKIDNEMFAGGSSHGAEDGQVWAAMYDAAPEAPIAAPAAANGALTDERAAFEAWAKDHLGQGYSLEIEEHTYANPVTRWAFVAFKAGRAILAAAGPDAAMVKALDSALAIINNEADPDEYAAPLKLIRAAISGAKGN